MLEKIQEDNSRRKSEGGQEKERGSAKTLGPREITKSPVLFRDIQMACAGVRVPAPLCLLP